MQSLKTVKRVLLAVLFVGMAGYLSVIVSGRVIEDRVAGSVAAGLRKQGAEMAVYVWPSATPDAASILERNGVTTRLCSDTEGAKCYPAAYLYRSTAIGPFVASVRWQYSRDHHGVGGTRRFFCFFGMVRELSQERTFIQ